MTALGAFVDGDVLDASELNAIANKTSFTPVWTNITVGNGTNEGWYATIQNMVFWQAQFTLGTTSSVSSGGVTVEFPITPAGDYLACLSAPNVLYDDNDGTDYYGTLRTTADTGGTGTLVLYRSDDTYLRFRNITDVIPFTWTTGDRIVIEGWYFL